MFQIGDDIVTSELAEQFFCCNLDACLGACCIEGDAGAPVTQQEVEQIEKALPVIWDDLLPRAQQEIKENGIAYRDPEGELVTAIIDGRNCAFSCYLPGGKCICALEKAYREGKTNFRKPISCYLYPVRVKQFNGFATVNYNRWKICKSAEVEGRRLNIRAFEFLKEPLIERFGEQWYNELEQNCRLYIKQYLQDDD
ncbi:MAG: DUF3109 family protein [Muribaculaceae bacterium]|nr:DUF3109 family protein [Muribaculaceae bacterium]